LYKSCLLGKIPPKFEPGGGCYAVILATATDGGISVLGRINK